MTEYSYVYLILKHIASSLKSNLFNHELQGTATWCPNYKRRPKRPHMLMVPRKALWRRLATWLVRTRIRGKVLSISRLQSFAFVGTFLFIYLALSLSHFPDLEQVKQMNNALKERKAVLAPQIIKLREVRKEFEEVEAEYGRKKSTYDKVNMCLLVSNLE